MPQTSPHSPSTHQTTPALSARQPVQWVVGIISAVICLNLLVGMASDFALARAYVLERHRFVRTSATVVDWTEGLSFQPGRFDPRLHRVTYEFRVSLEQTVRAAREVAGNDYAEMTTGTTIPISFHKDNPAISFLRAEEPLIVTIALRIVGLLVSAGLALRFGVWPLTKRWRGTQNKPTETE